MRLTPGMDNLTISAHPLPGAVDDFSKVTLRGPSQNLLSLGGVSHQNWGIAGATWTNFATNGLTGGGFGGMNHFEDGMSAAGAEVESERIAALFHMLKSAHVRIGQVVDVNV